jgi:hypothetical protein
LLGDIFFRQEKEQAKADRKVNDQNRKHKKRDHWPSSLTKRVSEKQPELRKWPEHNHETEKSKIFRVFTGPRKETACEALGQSKTKVFNIAVKLESEPDAAHKVD